MSGGVWEGVGRSYKTQEDSEGSMGLHWDLRGSEALNNTGSIFRHLGMVYGCLKEIWSAKEGRGVSSLLGPENDIDLRVFLYFRIALESLTVNTFAKFQLFL